MEESIQKIRGFTAHKIPPFSVFYFERTEDSKRISSEIDGKGEMSSMKRDELLYKADFPKEEHYRSCKPCTVHGRIWSELIELVLSGRAEKINFVVFEWKKLGEIREIHTNATTGHVSSNH